MNALTAIPSEDLSPGVHHLAFRSLRQHLRQKIIGQEHLVDSLLIAMLADGHFLVEGAPMIDKLKCLPLLELFFGYDRVRPLAYRVSDPNAEPRLTNARTA